LSGKTPFSASASDAGSPHTKSDAKHAEQSRQIVIKALCFSQYRRSRGVRPQSTVSFDEIVSAYG
jgi:hypothetical protein